MNPYFKSHSQAGQDAFVHFVLPKLDGKFIDIGCGHPINISNTYALEQLGWRGVLVDGDAEIERLCTEVRESPMIRGDATNISWACMYPSLGKVIDYASVDVDEATAKALANLLAYDFRFRVMTVEHDQYSRGERLRPVNRALMKQAGYDLLCADVHSCGCCFEDWFVEPALVDMKLAEPFRCSGLDWQDVLKKGGAICTP